MQIVESIFREYDIRGIYEEELNQELVEQLGYFLGKRVGGEKIVAIGFDARSHSPLLKKWLANGLASANCQVLDMGLVATPVNYFANYQPLSDLTKSQNSVNSIDASIMITGSHNPPEYNGFKITIDKLPFFGEDIYALRDEMKQSQKVTITPKEPIKIDVKSKYIEYMVKNFSHLKGLDKSIVIDCGNGVAGVVINDIFDALELNYKGLYCEPDGTFPNHHPDPSVEENLKDLKEAMQNENADLGFAYDGDADRIAVLTKKHNIKGDQLALLYAMKMQKPTVIGEVKCSQVMYDELTRRGAKAIMYKTGHSNLKVKMKETDADLACEVSGHIFFKHRYFGYDDAIYATLRLLELVKDGVDLDKEIDSLPKVYSTQEIKVKTTEDEKFKLVDKIKELLKNPPSTFPKIVDIIDVDGVRINFENGWGLVRASNTTPLLVTRFESKDKELAKEYEQRVNELILKAKEELNEE
jgi:phosphomannomutase/phosphoglucomutase